jgi:hypothetical protein
MGELSSHFSFLHKHFILQIFRCTSLPLYNNIDAYFHKMQRNYRAPNCNDMNSVCYSYCVPIISQY